MDEAVLRTLGVSVFSSLLEVREEPL